MKEKKSLSRRLTLTVSIDDRRERGPISSGPFLRHTVELERKQPKD